MVISITDTNISESSINDLFHRAEISVLELCHEYELDLMRSKALNEADGDSEEKNSKFATFISSIKLKIEELARKVTDTVRNIILKNTFSKYTKTMTDTRDENIEVFDIDGLEYYIENKKDFKFYNIINFGESKISNCETVEDFMKAFENSRMDLGHGIGTLSKYIETLYNSGSNTKLSKYIKDIKKDTLKQIDIDIKTKILAKKNQLNAQEL